jgi:hypothetical protein
MESYKMKNKFLLGLLLLGSFSQNTIFAGEGAAVAAQEEQVKCSLCSETCTQERRLKCSCGTTFYFHASCLKPDSEEPDGSYAIIECPQCKQKVVTHIINQRKKNLSDYALLLVCDEDNSDMQTDEISTCLICMEDNEQEEFITVRCTSKKHRFHKSCIGKAAVQSELNSDDSQSNFPCPLCRENLLPKREPNFINNREQSLFPQLGTLALIGAIGGFLAYKLLNQ